MDDTCLKNMSLKGDYDYLATIYFYMTVLLAVLYVNRTRFKHFNELVNKKFFCFAAR